MAGAGTRPGAAAGPLTNPNSDFPVSPDLPDGISALAFNRNVMPSNLLAAASWDNNVRIWEVSAGCNATAKAMMSSHTAPVLDCTFNSDGMKVFSGGCDKTAKVWDLASMQNTQVAQVCGRGGGFAQRRPRAPAGRGACCGAWSEAECAARWPTA